MKMATRLAAYVFAALLVTVPVAAQSAKTLEIYFIDVEGGQATLFVTPAHESLLVDTGWGGFESRDAKRIAAAAKLAGLTKIDYVVITHYHDDHVGGVPQLAALLPVGTFVDHGPLFEHCPTCVSGFNGYMTLLDEKKMKRLSVVAGDTLPIRGMKVRVVSSNGKVITKPLMPPAAANEFCAASEIRPDDVTENGKSVGIAVQFGKFRTADLGDLTWDMERKLMCPNNLVGDVSLLIVSHHGWLQSSSPAYVSAVHPRAAIMDNGEMKGGSLPTLQIFNGMHDTDLWQVHRSEEGKDANAPEARIANLSGAVDQDQGNYLKVSAKLDGTFSIFNARTGKTADYPAR